MSFNYNTEDITFGYTPDLTTTMRNMLVEAGHHVVLVSQYAESDYISLANRITVMLPSTLDERYTRHFRIIKTSDLGVHDDCWLSCITHPQHVVKILEDLPKLMEVLEMKKYMLDIVRLRGRVDTFEGMFDGTPVEKRFNQVLGLTRGMERYAKELETEFVKPYMSFDPSTLSAQSPFGSLEPSEGALIFDLSGFETDLTVVPIDTRGCTLTYENSTTIVVRLHDGEGGYYTHVLGIEHVNGRFEAVGDGWKYISPMGLEFYADGRILDVELM